MHRSPKGPPPADARELRGAGSSPALGLVHVVPDVAVDGRAIARAAAEERDSVYERWIKPAVDRLGAAVLLVLLAPVMLGTAMFVRMRLGKGVFYRQERVGWKGETFTVLKFRTMLPDRRSERVSYAGPDRRSRHKTNDDPRHTDFGRRLRDLSLDELPQLINVLRGELSLVGPRPELVDVVEKYEPWQHRRHAVKPGVTGLWQVTERDDRGEMHLHTETDLRYVRALSWLTDLKILVVTPFAVAGFALENSFGLRDLGKDPAPTLAPADAERRTA